MGYEAGRTGYGAGDQRVMPQNGNRPAYGGIQEGPYGESREGLARGAGGEGLCWNDFHFNEPLIVIFMMLLSIFHASLFISLIANSDWI